MRFWLKSSALIILFLLTAFQTQRFLKQERYSRINVNSNISKGHIYLNNQPAGTLNEQSYIIKNLSPGIYQLEIHGEGNQGIYLANIVLPPSEQVSVDAELPKRDTQISLMTKSSPSGAKLYIDDRFIGVTPQQNLKIDSGQHNIKITKEGFQIYEKQVIFENNQSYHLNISLYPQI